MSSYGMGSYGEYRPTSSSGSSGPGQVLDTVGEKVGSVGDKVSGAGETVGNKVSGVGETVGSAASQVTGGVGSAAGQVGDQARTFAGSATQMISENALAAGAIAVAAGAAHRPASCRRPRPSAGSWATPGPRRSTRRSRP